MECLAPANEVAANEVRKNMKSKGKKPKEGGKAEVVSESRPSIASAGVLRELPKQAPLAHSEGSGPKPADQVLSNEDCLVPAWCPVSFSDGIGKLDADGSQVPVKKTGQVVNALLALWLLNLAQPNEKNSQPRDAPAEGN
jgi:hypothetical protein